MGNNSVYRRYPAEWEKQYAVWLSWPHNEKEWENRRYGDTAKGRLKKLKEFYTNLINIVLNFQDVNLIIPSEEFSEETCCSMSQQKRHKLKKIIIPNNDIWIRDYGPFFLDVSRHCEEGRSPDEAISQTVSRSEDCRKPLILDFEFNSWGRKFPPWDLDNKVPKEIALYKGSKLESYPFILEGGAIEFSGNGIAATTEECLLNKNRNSSLKKEEVEIVLKSAFNLDEVIWLKKGLVSDHTDGHIDNVMRFVSEKKVVICKTNDKKNNNYQHLEENIRILKQWRHPKKGYKLEMIEIPLPDCRVLKSNQLPASYANFIFVNGGIIIPTFNCSSDKVVLEVFKKVFPDRKTVGIDCSLLIEEGGSLHCISKQEPLLSCL